MSQRPFATLTRRASLLGLGGGAIAAALSGSATSAARRGQRGKGGKKNRKRCQPQKANCQPAVAERCQAQQAECLAAIEDRCDSEGCVTRFAPCCDVLTASCDLAPFVDCLLSRFF